MIARRKRFESPAAIPSGMPTSEREPDGGEHQRERLHARLPETHQRERGERPERPTRPRASRRSGARRASPRPSCRPTSARAAAGRTTRRGCRRRSRTPSKTANTKLGSSALRWSSSQVWKLSRCTGSVFHVSARRPRVLERPGAVREYISPTIAATWTSFPRHQGRWSTTGTGGRVSAATDVTSVASLAGDRLQHRDAVDEPDDAPVLDRADGLLARGEHGDGVADDRRRRRASGRPSARPARARA